MQKKKQLVTMSELLVMGILPYTNLETIKRKVRSGEIKALHGTTKQRPRVYIPMEEVERLRRFFSPKKVKDGSSDDVS